MDEELAALEAEFASLQSALTQPTTAEVMDSLPFYNPLKVEQAKQQLMFDVPVGVARAGAGLADILSYPVIKGAQLAGVSPETLPTFGASQLVSTLAEKAAPYVGPTGVQPETGTQELISFLAPSPLSKASAAAQAGTGLASYLGMKGAEYAAPESEYAKLVGALAAPPAVTLAGKGVGAIASKLKEAGLGLQRRAFGITKADYKNAKNAVIETVSGDFSTQLKEGIDELIKNKTLGTSLDPGAMFAELQGAKSATEDAIQATLKAAESKIGPVPPPDFDKTIDYISKNIAADQVDKYVNNVIEFQDALRREGQGSLTYLNQQKKIIGENWKNSPQSDPGFWRTIYGDVKRHIEKYAPEVKDLNKEKQKLIIAEPIVARNFKAAGADYDIGAIQRLLNTTGGAGLAGGAILGAATDSLTGGVASALALRALTTPTGQNIVGRGLRGTASLAEALGNAGLDVGGVLQRGSLAAANTATPVEALQAETTDSKLTALESEFESLKELLGQATLQPESIKVGKQNVSIPTGKKYAPPSLVKAVIQVESAGKPEAVSSKGAGGLMQLMPATAKQLGVADRFDPEQNVEGGSRYLQQMLDKYGKTDIALAAYNWGPGNIDKAIRQVKADGKRVTWANIMQAVKVPQETRLYVNKVLNKEQKEPTKTEPSLLQVATNVGKLGLSIAPVTGEIISGMDTIESLRQGEYGSAAINALGVIPILGAASRLRKGAKIVDALADASKIADANKAVELEKIVAETGLKPELAEAVYRSQNALKSIDVDLLKNSIKSEQQLQTTYQHIVDQTRRHLKSGFNRGKPKSWLDERVARLDKYKTQLEKQNVKINDLKSQLKTLLEVK